MPDKKLTDNEIKKALEICMDMNKRECSKCYCYHKMPCTNALKKDVCALINRYEADLKIAENINHLQMEELQSLQAENEELVHKLECLLCYSTGGKLSKHTYPLDAMERCVNDTIQEYCEEAQAEAYKEFAERLKEWFRKESEVYKLINNLLKELVGDNNAETEKP